MRWNKNKIAIEIVMEGNIRTYYCLSIHTGIDVIVFFEYCREFLWDFLYLSNDRILISYFCQALLRTGTFLIDHGGRDFPARALNVAKNNNISAGLQPQSLSFFSPPPTLLLLRHFLSRIWINRKEKKLLLYLCSFFSKMSLLITTYLCSSSWHNYFLFLSQFPSSCQSS